MKNPHKPTAPKQSPFVLKQIMKCATEKTCRNVTQSETGSFPVHRRRARQIPMPNLEKAVGRLHPAHVHAEDET